MAGSLQDHISMLGTGKVYKRAQENIEKLATSQWALWE
jgi:hypothetical protein